MLVYPPSLDFMISFLACLKAGVIAVPVFPPNPLRRDTLNMFCKIVDGCEAQFALTNAAYNHIKTVAKIKDTVKLKRMTADWPESLTWIVTDAKKGAVKAKAAELDAPSRSDLAFLQYTSGSTSEPKGVMITHNNLAHNLTIITNELKAAEDTVVVSWLPQYHDMGLIGSYLGILYCGGTGYYMSPLSFLQRPMLWMENVSRFKATHLQAPNFAFKLTARKFDSSKYDKQSFDLSSVRHVINAAEPVDEDSIDTFYRTFGPFGFGQVIYPTYGLAEHTVFVCSGGKRRLKVDKKDLEVEGRVVLIEGKPKDETVSSLVGCGYPAHQGVDVKIVDTEKFEALPEDVVGEIWVNSPSKAAGYYRKEAETKEDFHAKLSRSVEAEGYLKTGDLGFMHGGELFICGRLKDLIIVGGRNYYPQDIEATAEVSADILRPGCSAAFTVDPTHEGGEEVALIMELKEVPSASDIEGVCAPLANEIRAIINKEHALGISIIAFLRTRTIPKTSSGKIARAWCRKGYIAGTLEIVFQKSFKSDVQPFEIEQSNGNETGESTAKLSARVLNEKDTEELRAMSKDDIFAKLLEDVSKVASIPASSIDRDSALATMLDSITLSQFKGILENSYAVKISDEYLFRETTTMRKLVEIVKIGYAPDDNADGHHDNAASPQHVSGPMPGKATGLAGALGCPPGVVCTIL